MQALKKQFLKYTTLNIVGTLGNTCYLLADTFFVAQATGSDGLAALNFAIAAFVFVISTGLMIGVGGGTDFSLRKHRVDEKNIALTESLILTGIASIIFLTVPLFFSQNVAMVLGARGYVMELTVIYIRTIFSFAPFFILNYVLQIFIRNDNNPQLPMIAMTVSSFSNIVLDYIFMFEFDMGIFGAAFATGLSPIISIAILSTHFFCKKNTLRIYRINFSFRRLFHILSLGTSTLISELAPGISVIVFNLIILSLLGNIGVAAYGVVTNIALVATSTFSGIALGIQPLASQTYGIGDHASLKKLLRYSIITALSLAAFIYTIIFVFATPISNAFNSEQDPVLTSIAVVGLRIYFLGYIAAGANIIIAAFLSAISSTKSAMVISLLRSSLVLLPAVFLLSTVLGMVGVWLSFLVTEIIVVSVSIFILQKSGMSATRKPS